MTDWLLGSLDSALFLGVGFVTGRRMRKPPRAAPAEEPICGCDHPLAMHDPQTGKCYEKVPADNSEKRGSYRWTGSCACRQYTGPKPIDQVFQPRVYLPPEES